MSDFTVSAASFTQSYRGFPVEQGNDVFQAVVRAEETSELSAGAKAVSVSEAGDALFISAAAAHMYAAQSEGEKHIHRRPPVDKYRGMYSSSAKVM